MEPLFNSEISLGERYTLFPIKADEQVLTAAKFKTGRGGTITEKKYSDTKPK